MLGADVLNNPRNNYHGRSSNYSQRVQLNPKHQRASFGALRRLNYLIV